jgi:hypothetical protein
MGYRSQVAGCISVDKVLIKPESGESYFDYDKTKFKEMVGFIKLSRFWELWNNKPDADNFGWKDGVFILYGNDWKWYPDYEDVRAWNDLWHSMQEVEGISGYFVRVGESADDIETEEFGDDPCSDYFYPFTGIDFTGEDFLGKRDTSEEEQAEQAQTDTQSNSESVDSQAQA